jgi:hypothetical protein
MDGKLALNMSSLRGRDDHKSRRMNKVVTAMAEAAQQEHDKDETDLQKALAAILNTAAAQTALCEHLTQRVDAERMRGSDKVDAQGLLREIVHSTTPPSAVDASHITWWCAEHLGLTIAGTVAIAPNLTENALKVSEKAKGGELSGKKGAEAKLKAAEAVATGEAAATCSRTRQAPRGPSSWRRLPRLRARSPSTRTRTTRRSRPPSPKIFASGCSRGQ